MSDVAYQSLYRRYRPQRFSEVLGQDHVVLALRNAVRDHKASHAYLFSGPRGTGKTSVARILAKALNCEHAVDGEPDGTCDSCLRIQEGNSLDVHELDAASNNGVDAMRDLVSRSALGSPGRWKVYIVDEVHMLSTAASNALLKTLEEPPAHVIFVLATTDPQKVLPTIRSRTQHFEFRLLSPELLGELVRQVNTSAGLQVDQAALDLVVRRGRGSARDTLSALDQVSAAGVVDDEHEIIDEITEALCERDTGRALIAVAEAMVSGRDPQRVAVDQLEYLRNGFLALMAKQLVSLPDNAADHVEEQARRLGAPALVRAMEVLGDALQQMRDAPEPRVTLEVALVRLTKPELNVDPAALLERIERLEAGRPASPAPIQQPAPERHQPQRPQSAPPSPQASARTTTSEPRRAVEPATPKGVVAPPPSRPSLGGVRRQANANAETSTQQKPSTGQSSLPVPEAGGGSFPTRDELVEAWGNKLLESLPQRARSRYRVGRFLSVEEGQAVFALPNVVHKDRCEEVRNEVEAVLRSHFKIRVPLKLVVQADDAPAPVDSPSAPTQAAAADNDDEHHEIDDTVDGEPMKLASPEERLLQAFPGAEEM